MKTRATLPLVLAIVALAAAWTAAGCGGGSSGSSDAQVEVVATTTQVADLVRQVGGDRVEVSQLLQPNSDPHGYEPRPSDVSAVSSADIAFQSGGDVDEWLGELIESAGGDIRAERLIDSVETIEGDPHWWQDPRNAMLAVDSIAAALSEADPEERERYRANAAAYADSLRRLDRNVVACLDRLRPEQRKLVTTHDALGYYAHRYDLEVIGALIPSLSTSAQPSARDTERLVDQVEEQGVEAIFPESSVSPKLEQAVAREAGASVGRPLWADTLGPEGSSGETYVESIQSNTAAIVEGLSGGAERCRPQA